MTVGHTAKKHAIIRKLQKENDDSFHHPAEKILQLERLGAYIHGDVLEVFAGQGNLTQWYLERATVEAMTKETHGDSFKAIHTLRGEGKKYDVIDIDSYGYPDAFFPTVFEMMKDTCLLVFTFPVLGVNCLNGIVEQHFINYWHSDRPSIGDVTGVLTDMALREWYILSLIDVVKIKKIWRFAYVCKRHKATELCNVRNH